MLTECARFPEVTPALSAGKHLIPGAALRRLGSTQVSSSNVSSLGNRRSHTNLSRSASEGPSGPSYFDSTCSVPLCPCRLPRNCRNTWLLEGSCNSYISCCPLYMPFPLVSVCVSPAQRKGFCFIWQSMASDKSVLCMWLASGECLWHEWLRVYQIESYLQSLIQQPQPSSPQLGIKEYDAFWNSRNGVIRRSITKICALSKGNHPATSQ